MSKTARTWPRFVSALILALGVGVAWGVAIFWTGYLGTSIWQGSNNIYENVQVLVNGTPVIQSYTSQSGFDQTYRMIDGKPLSLDSTEMLNGVYLWPSALKPSQHEFPLPWRERIISASDNQRPPTAWYLIRDDEPVGKAYFVGYDELTKLRVGFMGRSGFRRALPPRDEWFDVGRNPLSSMPSVAASTGYLQFGGRPYTYAYAAEAGIPPWKVFLIDGDQLLEIDLRTRAVRPILEQRGMLSLSTLTESRLAASQEAAATEAAADEATAKASGRSSFVTRIAILLADRLIVFDPPSNSKRAFVLPDTIRNDYIYYYSIGGNQLLVVSWNLPNSDGPTNLTWIQPEGTIARQESVTLARNPQPTERETAWMIAPVATVPLGWVIGAGALGPWGLMQTNQAANFSEGLSKTLMYAWPPLVAVLAIGAALTWITYRLQQKYHRSATPLWCGFVLLFGVPAFFAYLLVHRPTKLESCASCKEIVPRDREACADCDTQFPTPTLVGTEIFA